jgi:hypothetical protein
MFGEIIENRDSHRSSIPGLLGVFLPGFIVRIRFLAWRGPEVSFDSNECLFRFVNAAMGAMFISQRIRASHLSTSTG